jgi:BirA family biotin operon repressor/biotin-[acetyl-CoA-carboxylase] ligase
VRPGFDVEQVRTAVAGPASPWVRIEAVEQTGSTNADLAAGARAGTWPDGSVLLAELQVAGRGRLGRDWSAPPGLALTFSVLLDPEVPPARWGWLPLLAGVALVDAVTATSAVRAVLKWPNDLLAPDGRKLAGILSERVDTASGPRAVVGFGLNVNQTAADLPVDTATSLRVASGEPLSREAVLVAVLDRLASRLRAWVDAGGEPDGGPDPLRSAYRARCGTLGSDVRVLLPGEEELRGTARDVDADGRLVVQAPDGTRVAVAAGDVLHVR